MKKRMYFNAFRMNCVTHMSPGLWVRDDDEMVEYTSLTHWTEFARLLERGCFDGVFLADVVGPYDVYGNSRDAALVNATHVPINDPMLLVPAMAAATEHLGFGFTSSIMQYHPFMFSRLMTTLDHLTNGRVAWNIVTSFTRSAARSFGHDNLPEHDERYEMADEYCRVCYRLWEDSWADDAVLADKRRSIYADPARVRDIDHDGKYYAVHGCHLCEPSPQRTPVLFQAGTSDRGSAFAAENAECIFVIGANPAVAGDYARTIREKTAAFGRRPEDILCFAYMKIIVGGTEAEAQAKYAEYSEQVSVEGALALLSAWTGVDFSGYDPDQPIEYIDTNAVRTVLHSFTAGDPGRTWTVGDVARYIGIGGAGPVLVGAPEQIADQLEDWIDAGVDGFNLSYATLPATFEEFVDGVVPVLQRRGRMQTSYRPGTLREKLFDGSGPRIELPHPAAACRQPW
ncbi:MAG: LLM class flavin-dependent oxidoreductase [Gammaproteobacteria bacterium]